MYSKTPSSILGFHGCDLSTKEKILKGHDRLRQHPNSYDWLGHGIYFWENDSDRALTYAKFIKAHPERCSTKIDTPAVIGAIIDLKYCLNLFEEKSLGYLKGSYQILSALQKASGAPMPINKKIEDEKDVLMRQLDCAVIEYLHTYNNEQHKKTYDSV